MNWVKNHSIILIYHFVFFILGYGVFSTSGTNYLIHLSIFYTALVSSYFLTSFAFAKKTSSLSIPFIDHPKTTLILFFSCITLIILHFIYLKDFPALTAWGFEKNHEVVNFRRSITTNAFTLVNYIVSFNVKSIIPITLLLLIIKKKKKLYWILYILSSFYAFNLMQKSYIVVIHGPILIYCLFQKKWLHSLKYLIMCSSIVTILVTIHNPELNTNNKENIVQQPDEINNEKMVNKKPSNGFTIINSLKKRIIIVPGKTVSGWFENIPKNLPFQYGNGYRFLTRLNGNEYINYAQKLYPIMYPKHAKKGLKGNVNVASFMYEYANFGIYGLILSGAFLGLLFLSIEKIFVNNLTLKLAVNLIPVLILSSQAITTLLFSGGWGLSILLYLFIVKPNIK